MSATQDVMLSDFANLRNNDCYWSKTTRQDKTGMQQICKKCCCPHFLDTFFSKIIFNEAFTFLSLKTKDKRLEDG